MMHDFTFLFNHYIFYRTQHNYQNDSSAFKSGKKLHNKIGIKHFSLLHKKYKRQQLTSFLLLTKSTFQINCSFYRLA